MAAIEISKILACTLILLLATTCSSENGDSNEDAGSTSETSTGSGALQLGTLAMNVTALSSDTSFTSSNNSNFSGSPGSLAIGSSLHKSTNLLSETPPVDKPKQIVSGAPSGFKLTIKKITIKNNSSNSLGLKLDESPDSKQDNKNSSTGVIFESKTGVEISVDSGEIDLSALLSAISADSSIGSTASFSAPVGTYDSVEVTFKRAAKIKGCLTAEFDSLAKISDPGASQGSTLTGSHTYCTTAGASLYDEYDSSGKDIANATYEDTTADWMKFDLKGFDAGPTESSKTYKNQGYMPDSTADAEYSVNFTVPKAFEIKADETTPITMLLDLNRMLRYYNQGDWNVDPSQMEGPNPTFPVNRPYFFNSVFNTSIFVFAGSPGRAYGYEMVAKGCAESGNKNAECTSDDTNAPLIALWLTIITSPDGSPLILSMMPDDDRDFTVIKGDLNSLARDFNGEEQAADCTKFKTMFNTSKTTIEVTDLITKNDTSGVDIWYGLGCKMFGRIRQFPVDLEATSIGDTATGVWYQLEFNKTLEDENGIGTSIYSSKLYVTRKL